MVIIMNITSNKLEFVKPELTVEELSIALYHANRKLEQTNRELLHSREELSEVFENISHDLRSPVSAIVSSVEYLLSCDTFEPVEVMQTLKLIGHRAEYLEQLINDVLLLSLFNSSHKIFNYETVNIGMVLETFFFNCESDHKYAKRNLYLKVPEDFPYHVSIDCKMIVRVLDNLISNALKFSTEGASITLSACCKDNNMILISVSDTGVGIAAEHISKIFNRTYMVSSARTPGKSVGCGLGLAIAKSVVENHGGSIWCESKPGKGSCFKFTLPLASVKLNL